MVDRPYVTWPFAATGAPTPRTMPDRIADIVNVKEFGATGDGGTVDDVAIQAAINAAFTSGPPLFTPHGVNSYLNKQVFFPNGHYILHNPINLIQVQGGKIFGACRQATTLENTFGGSIFATNGFKNSMISDMHLKSANGATDPSIELSWNGSGSVGLSGNTFLSLDLGGTGAALGVRIGNGGFEGIGNLFLSCYFSECTRAGLETVADPAVGNSVIGGNSTSATGILVTRGSVTITEGIGFQFSSVFDIEIKSTAAGGMAAIGHRTESPNFFKATTTYPVSLTANTHSPGAFPDGTLNGTFAFLDGCPATIEGCFSRYGAVSCRNGVRVSISNYVTNVATASWLDAPAAGLWFTPTNPIQATIELENVLYDNQPSGTKVHLFKQRKDTIDGSTLRTRNYTVTP